MALGTISRETVPFLPDDSFILQNGQALIGLFSELATDFPDRTVSIDGQELDTKAALRLDELGELTPEAREWLDVHTVGKQHGYDRQEDKRQKIYIEPGDVKYMASLALINCGEYNFVKGGAEAPNTVDKNILVGGGFPHLNAGRLRAALAADYDRLWDVNNVSILAGQRRRWNDNENEATASVVFERTSLFTDFDPKNNADNRLLATWEKTSQFARQEALKSEGTDWEQSYATEADMGRLALELALLRASDDLFEWNDYPVIEHLDDASEPYTIEGFHIPARRVRAWEYITGNGKSFYVINGAAVVRDKGGEPRPTSASVIREAHGLLAPAIGNSESVIAFGAPHIRAAYDTAAKLIVAANGQLKPLGLSIDHWEFHEPPVTGIASILGMDRADKELRNLLALS